jgi:probable F420-dependent oxidoreductase
VQIGLLLGGLADANALAALAAEAEALGFDSLWAGDHIAFPAPILDPLQVLACCASRTQRVRLGTCVYLLALRHPTVVAKMVASLDFISGGRVVFGVGVGGEFPGEFQASGVPVQERGARTNEGIVVLRQLWQGDEASHSGRFFRIDRVRLKPPPVQPGGPPIWIGGRSDAAARPITAALMTFAVVDPDRASALQRAGAILGAMYGRSMESAAARYCIAGTPDDCRAAAQRYADAGVEHLVLTPLAYGDGTTEQVRALAAALRR